MGRLGLLEVIKGVAPPKIYEIMMVDMTGIPEPTSLSTVRDQLAYCIAQRWSTSGWGGCLRSIVGVV